MADIFKFQQEDEDCQCEEVCHQCLMVQEYLADVLEAETPEEVHELLQALSDDSFGEGFKSAVAHDVHFKMQMLDWFSFVNRLIFIQIINVFN